MRQILVFSALAIAAMFIFTSNVNAETEYENPDLQLKFNWKEEGDGLSPQTKLPNDPEAHRVMGSIKFFFEVFLVLNFFEILLKNSFLVTGKIKRNPKISVANPGIIKSKAAKAIAAPEITS